MIAYELRDRYEALIREINKEYYNDYVDTLPVLRAHPHEFDLKYVPTENNLRLYVNGVWYDESAYTLDRETKKLRWIFDVNHGGFQLGEDFDVQAIYDITLADNPDLTSLDDIS